MFSSKNEEEPIAKVHDTYFYKEDLEKSHFPEGLTEKDSVSILTEFIDNWAMEQLLVYQAKQNMPLKQQQDFEYLVTKYRNELYSNAYKNVYVQQNLNTDVDFVEVKAYYKDHKRSFLLKQNLLKVRYIKVPLNYKDVNATKKLLNRYNEDDIDEIGKMVPGFLNSYLNEEDNWITYQDLITKIPKLSTISDAKVFTPKSTLVFSDKKGKYLLRVLKVLKIGGITPVEFVTEDIKQIIVNKRKLELQKKLEKEILKDALQANDYEIFQ